MFSKILLVLVLIGFTSACSNPGTPVGHEGYVRQKAIVGKARYYDTQIGPSSTGLGWLLRVENVDFRWATYSETFKVMSADNLELSFHAHVVMRPKPSTVKDIVETYGGMEWYNRNIQQPFRNSIYESVAGYKALEAKDKREEIAKRARDKFFSYLRDKPFEVQSVVVGTIDLPALVATAQELKITKETELERKGFEVAIAKQDALVRVEEAKGIAESQHIINATLTPQYLQHEAIKAQEKMATSPNHTTVYIPSGSNGIPLVKILPEK